MTSPTPHTPKHASQFALLTQRRFAPFFWTQFLGAGNDNLFKWALTVMITYQLRLEWLPSEMAGLDEIKAALARMAPHLASGLPGPPFRPDDLFFLAELLRRYVPDTLQAYLQVPRAQRNVAVAAVSELADSANAVLCAQLVSLQAQVAEREQRLAQAQAEPLLQQGRFLRAKRGL